MITFIYFNDSHYLLPLIPWLIFVWVLMCIIKKLQLATPQKEQNYVIHTYHKDFNCLEKTTQRMLFYLICKLVSMKTFFFFLLLLELESLVYSFSDTTCSDIKKEESWLNLTSSGDHSYRKLWRLYHYFSTIQRNINKNDLFTDLLVFFSQILVITERILTNDLRPTVRINRRRSLQNRM